MQHMSEARTVQQPGSFPEEHAEFLLRGPAGLIECAVDVPETGAGRPADGLFRVAFEDLVKGSVVERKDGVVRQVGVTVGGAVRLVTSGDLVDRATYEALVAAGALRRGKE